MKKQINFILLVVIIAITTSSWLTNPIEKGYKIVPEETQVTWTAYKTTNKIPVTGIFKEVFIESKNSGATIYEALDGTKFSLPVNSIFSQSNLRDGKIINSFFGKMLNTTEILGTIKLIDKTTGVVKITMNGISEDLPISFNISDNLITIDAKMNVNNWKAQAELEALTDACEDLHAGVDGESVTWSEVKINVTSKVKFE